MRQLRLVKEKEKNIEVITEKEIVELIDTVVRPVFLADYQNCSKIRLLNSGSFKNRGLLLDAKSGSEFEIIEDEQGFKILILKYLKIMGGETGGV